MVIFYTSNDRFTRGPVDTLLLHPLNDGEHGRILRIKIWRNRNEIHTVTI